VTILRIRIFWDVILRWEFQCFSTHRRDVSS